MRALVVCAVRSPGVEPLVAREASRAGVVIAADGGARLLMAAGITPDLVVGDADSLGPAELDELRARGVVIELHPVDKDATDLDLALAAARGRGAKSVVVIGATGGRLDHTLGTLGSLAGAVDLAPELVYPNVHGWVLGASGRDRLELLGTGAVVSVQSLSPNARVVTSGLKWPTDGLVLPLLGTRGVSNRILDDSATVAVTEGVVVVTTTSAEGNPLARLRV